MALSNKLCFLVLSNMNMFGYCAFITVRCLDPSRATSWEEIDRAVDQFNTQVSSYPLNQKKK